MGEELTLTAHQIARLLADGMITHVMTPPDDGLAWSIDPSTIRDLDALKLLVVLDDGTVAIACPDGLPDVLRSAATPMEVAPFTAPPSDISDLPDLPAAEDEQPVPVSDSDVTAPELAAAPDDDMDPTIARVAPTAENELLLSRLDDLGARIEAIGTNLLAALQQGQDTRPALTEDSIGTQFAALQTSISNLRALMQQGPDQTQIIDSLAALTDRVTTPLPSASALDKGDAERLIRIEDTLNALAARTVPRPDLTAVHQAIARQTTAIATTVRRLEAIATSAPPPAVVPFEEIMARLDAIDVAVAQPRMVAPVTAAPSAAEIADDVARVILPHRAALDETLVALMRQQMARHATAQATALRRLDAIADRFDMADRPVDAPPTEAAMADLCGVLADLRDALTTPVTTLAPLGDTTDGTMWSRQVAGLDATQRISFAEGIAASLKALSPDAAPIVR